MRIELKCLESGEVKTTVYKKQFDNENKATQVIVHYPTNYLDYNKRCDVVNGGNKSFKVGDEFYLTNLVTGEVDIQPIAFRNDEVIKWRTVKIKVEQSLNVLEDDETVTESIAEELLNLILTKQDKIELEPTWENLVKLLKGEI